MYKRSEFVKRTYKTGEVAEFLQLHPQSVIRQDKQGKLKFHRNEANRRVMLREDLLEYLDKKGMLFNDLEGNKKDVIYCRVSSHEQKMKGDLDRQVVHVMEFAQSYHLINPVILKEVGSGLNDNRKEIQKLIKMIINDEVNRIFISYKDRLTRFGYHYIEAICKEKNVEIHVSSDEEFNKSVQEEMVEDMMSLIASFSGKLYGLRSRAKKKMMKDIEKIPLAEDENE